MTKKIVIPIKSDDDWPAVELPSGQFIVKVQLSLTSPPQVLVYDRERRYCYEGPLSDDLQRFASDRMRFFCAAQVDTGSGVLTLGELPSAPLDWLKP